VIVPLLVRRRSRWWSRLTLRAMTLLRAFVRETEELLVVVEHDQAEAEVQERIVSADVEEANKVAAEVQVRQTAISS
jgi:ABC-type lipoprotein export system ATPase subunit